MKKDSSNFSRSDQRMKVTFEELHIRHINLLVDIKNKELNNWFLKMAIINTFDDLKIFLNNLRKSKNKCIIAIYGNEIIGYLNIYPLNNKETCLKISKPKLISNNCYLTDKQLSLGLIKKSISITDIKTSSWILNSDIGNIDLISTSRELGFQPLGEVILWTVCNPNKTKKQNNQNNELIKEFQEISKGNLVKVVNFLRSNQSPLIRNILDFDQNDILKRNDINSGAIIYDDSILCTILKDINYQNEEIYTLTISRYWDNRFNPILKKFINRFFVKAPTSILKTYKENKQLNSYIDKCDVDEKTQEIILLRNTFIKNESKNVNKINKSLESIFERLSPQGNPYPSPFPLKTK